MLGITIPRPLPYIATKLNWHMTLTSFPARGGPPRGYFHFDALFKPNFNQKISYL